MTPSRGSGLHRRIDAHFAAFRSSALGEILKRSAGDWKLYATVTGSALAMATNAAAGSVTYSGIQDVITTPPLASEHFPSSSRSAGVKLTGGPSFRIGVAQYASDFWQGLAGVNGNGKVNFLLSSKSSPFLEMLGAGATISASAKAGIFGAGPRPGFIGAQRVGSFMTYNSANVLVPVVLDTQIGWPASHTGFAGFSFSNGGQTNYGWVRLEYFEGADHLSNQIEAVDWAFTNGPITTPTPEPSTFALGLLAAGAVGVAALRKRRSARP